DNGTIFSLNKDGTDFVVLRSFADTGGDGAQPNSGVKIGSDGALYGTTARGGSADRGTVFTLNKDGSNYAVLHSFTGTAGDGEQPVGRLVEGTDGALYGATFSGGDSGRGTVFRLTRDGKAYRVLHSFTGVDGEHPLEGLLAASDGALY